MTETVALDLDLRGYRWWRCGRRGTLRSPWYGRHLWQAGTNTARCNARRNVVDLIAGRHAHGVVPGDTCRCGFYGMTLLPDDDRWPDPSFQVDVGSSGSSHTMVFGVAQASGSVLLAERGWRAEKAAVRALYVGDPARVDVGALARRYGVAVYREVEALVAEWGPGDEVEAILAA